MIAVLGILENGQITLLEPVPQKNKKIKVIVILLESHSPEQNQKRILGG